MDECGESLNLAVNAVADVLHTLYTEACTERRGDINGDGQITVYQTQISVHDTIILKTSSKADNVAQTSP